MVAGQAPRKVAAGEGFVIPAGVVHNARNEGAAPVKLVGIVMAGMALNPPEHIPPDRDCD